MIKCIAIDDEPIALSIIAEYCRRHGDIELETYTSPVEGMARVEEWNPDILFLDIEMNSHNGVELARRLPGDICLIFTTAYSRYALDGFEADAVDFLHKPIFYPRFVKAIDKALRRMASSGERGQDAGAGFRAPAVLTLKAGYRNVVVNLDDITHIEAMDNYVKVYRRDLATVVSQITMKDMEAQLPGDRFIRVHRSFIVALGAVDSYTRSQVRLRGVASPVPVGRKYVASLADLDR